MDNINGGIIIVYLLVKIKDIPINNMYDIKYILFLFTVITFPPLEEIPDTFY